MQQSKPFPRVLTIAGSDSGGGAGIQADLKTFGALGAYGASVITAVTAQNTQGVQGVHVVPAAMIAAQCDSVLSDIRIDAVKIGMLPDVESIKAVAHALREYPVPFVVFDPVLVATSGDSLALENTLDALCGLLLPLADVVTPNLNELAQLTGNALAQDEAEMLAQGRQLLAKGAKAALLKGGHWQGCEEARDWLVRLGLLAAESRVIGTHRDDFDLATLPARALAAIEARHPDRVTVLRMVDLGDQGYAVAPAPARLPVARALP